MSEDDGTMPLSETTSGWPIPVDRTSRTVLLGVVRRLGWQFGLVLVAAAAGCWSPELGFPLFLVGLLIVPALTIGNAALGAISLWRALTSRVGDGLRALATAGLFAATLGSIVAVPIAVRGGVLLGDELLLLAYGSHYRAIIAQVQRQRPAEVATGAWRRDGVVTFVVDAGPPRRVAFEPGGLLDNWSAIIWDPSHDVMNAHGFDPVTGRFAAPERITKLFGGDLVGCTRLSGDWFDCSFT